LTARIAFSDSSKIILTQRKFIPFLAPTFQCVRTGDLIDFTSLIFSFYRISVVKTVSPRVSVTNIFASYACLHSNVFSMAVSSSHIISSFHRLSHFPGWLSYVFLQLSFWYISYPIYMTKLLLGSLDRAEFLPFFPADYNVY